MCPCIDLGIDKRRICHDLYFDNVFHLSPLLTFSYARHCYGSSIFSSASHRSRIMQPLYKKFFLVFDKITPLQVTIISMDFSLKLWSSQGWCCYNFYTQRKGININISFNSCIRQPSSWCPASVFHQKSASFSSLSIDFHHLDPFITSISFKVTWENIGIATSQKHLY